MTEVREPLPDGPPPPPGDQLGAPSVAQRLALWQRAGGIATPLVTAFLAFAVGGLVVLVTTGKNPLSTYKAIFSGTGIDWFFQIHTSSSFPWIWDPTSVAALNLQQTLLLATPLALTGLAVAFAFRCGLFNIGGQGQYTVGVIVSVWVGSSMGSLAGPAHMALAVGLATLAGGLYAGIAGILRATVGTHEVIATIMLNWVAYWGGSYLFGLGGPLQNPATPSVPVSSDVVENARLNVFWGDPVLQGLHIGFFIAIAALVVYWMTLNRTTLGYEVRATGFNPEAARYGGISVARSYFMAMAISGLFAGLAGAVDVLGWEFRINTNDIQASAIGFTGIAVALLGRNTAIGVALSALLFGALVNGTSTRNLDESIFRPDLASNLTLLIQGLVILFVGADVLVLWFWSKFRRKR